MSDTSDAMPTEIDRAFAEFAPGFASFTQDVVLGQLWKRTELSPRDRSLVTVASLITSGSVEPLSFHFDLAKQHGVTQQELVEVITHMAFYAGWPKAAAALMLAKRVFDGA